MIAITLFDHWNHVQRATEDRTSCFLTLTPQRPHTRSLYRNSAPTDGLALFVGRPTSHNVAICWWARYLKTKTVGISVREYEYLTTDHTLQTTQVTAVHAVSPCKILSLYTSLLHTVGLIMTVFNSGAENISYYMATVRCVHALTCRSFCSRKIEQRTVVLLWNSFHADEEWIWHGAKKWDCTNGLHP